MKRDDMLAMVNDTKQWDVVVIGGGATGLGAALDAVSRGYHTILLEAEDFAKGTSSRSTKLIHGGVRYLRSGQVGMVRESLRERSRLIRNAPHLVQSMKFTIPSYRWGRRWYFYVGMKAYDVLAGRDGLENSALLSSDQVKKAVPTIKTDRLRGGVSYIDCQFDDSRLAVSLAQTIISKGGVALNYSKVACLSKISSGGYAVQFKDCETGSTHEIHGRAVINATGVFAANIMAMDKSSHVERRPHVVPSQGSHVVLSRDFLPSQDALMVPETDDGRVLFAIPWYGHTLLGTTDKAVERISVDPKPDDDEINYLLDHASRYLNMTPHRSDVVSAFAGLRPLVGKSGTSQSTASLSREHEIHVSGGGLVTVIGGKWTTYRKMGEDVMDIAAEKAGLEGARSSTAEMRLYGCRKTNKSPASSDLATFSQYGAFSEEIQKMIEADPDLGNKLHENFPFVAAQVVWAVRHELARTIEDVLARRIRMLFLNARAAIDAAPLVGKVMASGLRKDENWVENQLAEFEATASRYLIV